MGDSLRGVPRYARPAGTGWEGADHLDGPWRPIPGPQPVSALWEQQPAPAGTTLADRLALALCAENTDLNTCQRACQDCRDLSVAVARELAQVLRERHGGSSTVADWLDGIGCHG